MVPRHYVIIERYRDVRAVYARYREHGRMTPEGLTYVTSWVTEALDTCYQVMATNDAALIDEWMAKWSDVVDFEVIPVLNSEDAAVRARATL